MPNPFSRSHPWLAALLVLIASCAPPPPEERDATFWSNLQALCGQAFAGRMVAGNPQDSILARERLVMHVLSCSEDEVRIPFHVGEDRSRTWVLTRSDSGFRLVHDHRHEDGSADAITGYGGTMEGADALTTTRLEFPADQYTADLVPAARTNVWALELVPPGLFAYELRRVGTDRRIRVEFDLTAPVEPPPPPWGQGAEG